MSAARRPDPYISELGAPARNGTMASNTGGLTVSVVMSWIDGTDSMVINCGNITITGNELSTMVINR